MNEWHSSETEETNNKNRSKKIANSTETANSKLFTQNNEKSKSCEIELQKLLLYKKSSRTIEQEQEEQKLDNESKEECLKFGSGKIQLPLIDPEITLALADKITSEYKTLAEYMKLTRKKSKTSDADIKITAEYKTVKIMKLVNFFELSLKYINEFSHIYRVYSKNGDQKSNEVANITLILLNLISEGFLDAYSSYPKTNNYLNKVNFDLNAYESKVSYIDQNFSIEDFIKEDEDGRNNKLEEIIMHFSLNN